MQRTPASAFCLGSTSLGWREPPPPHPHPLCSLCGVTRVASGKIPGTDSAGLSCGWSEVPPGAGEGQGAAYLPEGPSRFRRPSTSRGRKSDPQASNVWA